MCFCFRGRCVLLEHKQEQEHKGGRRKKGGRIESAGINRHRVGDERALHKRRSCSIMAPSQIAS